MVCRLSKKLPFSTGGRRAKKKNSYNVYIYITLKQSEKNAFERDETSRISNDLGIALYHCTGTIKLQTAKTFDNVSGERRRRCIEFARVPGSRTVQNYPKSENELYAYG